MKINIRIFIIIALSILNSNLSFSFLGYSRTHDIDRFYQSDSERYNEYKDCTVIALAFAQDKGYDKAHKELESLGRIKGNGIVFKDIADKIKGLKEVNNWKDKTVRKFVKENRKGKYLILIDRHIFVVIDGIIYDDGYKRGSRKIVKVYEVR